MHVLVSDKVPSFKWRSTDGGSQQLKVNSDVYWNGEFEIDLKLGNFYSDVAVLKPIKSKFMHKSRGDKRRNTCILKGYLRSDKNVPVTVAGCPFNDTFQVSSHFALYILKKYFAMLVGLLIFNVLVNENALIPYSFKFRL